MVVVTMSMLNLLMERLRLLVGSGGWDYCVLWTISNDQRLIEWMDCCCSGAENDRTHGEDYHFPVSPNLCRDVLFQHTRTEACELLAQLPSSMSLDSGIYTDALTSSQPRWLNISSNDEMLGTKVLIPLAGVLVELYSVKQVPEDQGILNFITAQCSVLIKPDSLLPVNNIEANYAVTVNTADELHPKPYFTEMKDQNNLFQPPNSQPLAEAHMNLNLPYDISHDKIQLYGSQGNILENYNYKPDDKIENDVILEVLSNSFVKKVRLPSADNGIQDMEAPENGFTNVDNVHMQFGEPSMNMEQQGNDNIPMKPDTGRSDSISDCSDQNEDDDICRNGKRSQSKNLHAERKRRKKLNDRLYALRALVPNISKLDRASILGDAIEFIRDLQRQAKELQDELEEHSDVEDGKNSELDDNHNNALPEVLSPKGHKAGFAIASDKGTMGQQLSRTCSNTTKKQTYDAENPCSKQQQMEPQVEVSPIDGNEFFIKVFGEHRSGAFVRLMEALDALGLEVVNANMTSFLSLVSNVFIVEKKDCDTLEADQVKDSLLEVTRNPSAAWTGMSKISEAGTSKDCTQRHFHLLQNHHFNSHSHHLPG